MIIKLYIARVLLEALGVDDYGIWNIIAAFVISFQFVSSPIVVSTQRFLNYDMGKGGKQLTKIFNISFELILIVCLILFIGLETGGAWFVDTKMKFPPDRIHDVHILFQLTIFSLLFQLSQKPFESTVLAHEKMSWYAYISLFEAIFLLSITVILKSDIPSNKLIWYGWMNLGLYATEFIIYLTYCRTKFPSCRFKLIWDKTLVKDITTFSGWNLFGGLSSMTANQGVNILLNIFFNITVNAAFGVSQQVRSAVTTIVGNLQRAFDPQIVKSYSAGDSVRMHTLVKSILSLAFILAFCFIFPLIFNFQFILKIWLGSNIPPYAYWFCVLSLIQMLFVSIGNPIDTAIFATGKIKKYQLFLSSEIFLNVILCYILFKSGFNPVWAFVVRIFVEVIIVITRIFFLRRIGLGVRHLGKTVFLPLIIITVLTVISTYLLFNLLMLSDEWIKLITSTLFSLSIILILSWWLLLSPEIRSKATSKIKALIKPSK